MAKNDWIVAGLNNPDFTSYDFSNIADMNLDNTQMLSADEYLKSDFIRNNDLFKNESGEFSEDKFRQYHKKRLEDFREFQEQEFPKGPQLDLFDTDRTQKSRVKDIRFDLGRHVNPDRQAVGIEGMRVWSDPTQTKSEIAQSQKIWDSAKQEFKDYSSNDKALSNGLFDWLGQVFSDPLVMAQWEEDGEHIDPITGITKQHKKGDYKLNDKGTYYYETLNDRSPIGKEVLSVFDTLTVDGEGLNKYDFFDSDDVKKSVGGVIAKNVAALLPIFTPIGTAYSALLVAKEFAKAMPMLYGIATMLGDSQEQPKWINNVAAYGSKMSGGTSQYAKENTFSFENFGNLIADVALQWGQQKAIASAFNKIKGSQTYVDDALKNAQELYKVKSKQLGESAELWKVCQDRFLPEAQKLAQQASNLGRDASLAYMAIVSNSDLYNEMRGMGLTNTEAAAISLGSTLGMFGLNKYTGLGEVFFDDATDDAVKMARHVVKAEMKDAAGMFKAIKASNLPEPNKYLSYIKIASDKVKGVFSKFNEDLKYHTLNFAGKAAGEGLEEVSEELISDVAKEIYQLAGQFGVDTTLKDVGAWDNALERYAMSFLGGAIGGGIFYGKEAVIDGKSYKRDSKNWEMATLIRNGHGNELRAEIEKMKKEGKLGKTKLSASKYEIDEKGDRVWLTTDNKEESQNDVIANAMLEKVNALEAVINNNRIGLSDEQLFENMVLTEKRYKRYEKIAPLTNYYQDFSNIINDLIAAELDYRKASETIEGTVNGTPKTDIKLTPEQEATRQQQLQQLLARVEEARQKKDEFLSGDTSLEYTRKLNFIMDPALHEQYLSIDKGQFFKQQYGDRNYSELTAEELIKFEQDWQKKVETTLKEEINQSWEKYKSIEALILPELEQLAANTPEYKRFSKETEALFQGDLSTNKLFESYLKWDSKLDSETDEKFERRNEKLIIPTQVTDADGNLVMQDLEESEAAFQLRKLQRMRQIEAYNQKKDQEWVDKVNAHLAKVQHKLDPFTYRYLKRTLPQRQRDIVDRKLSLTILSPHVRNIFKQLKPDLSNVDEVKDLLYQYTKQEVIQAIQKPTRLNLVNDEGNPVDLNEYMMTSYDGDSTLNEIAADPTMLDIQDEQFIESLTALIPIVGGDVTLYEVIQEGAKLAQLDSVEDYIKQRNSSQENQLSSFIVDVKSNPIYNLANQLKTQVKNPIGELIRALSQKNRDDIPNIDELLDIIQNDFENVEDVSQLLLDDTQMTNLNKIKDYMKLIDGFMYATSSNPNKDNPMGHNQVINSFAKNHKDQLLKKWAPLPEIDSDYYTLYSQAISQYASEIEYWIDMSNNNNVNKIRKFIATDRAFNVALYDSIKARDLKFTWDGEQFDLLEGLVEGGEDPEIKLFNVEKILHNNFQKALVKSGLTVPEFLSKTGLLEKLVPSISNISKQNVASLSDTLKKEDLTDFDLIQYFAHVFTLNPSKFYSELKSRVKNNEKVAPITAQEYSVKLAQAITSQQYRDIIAYAYEKSGSKLPYLSNTLIIPGVAGAGKTVVVLSSVNNPDEDVIVAGPTKKQADTLAKALHRTESETFQDLLKKLLGNDLLSKIVTELDKVSNGDTIQNHDSEYFTVYPVSGSAVIKLKPESIKFNTLEKTPKKIFLDEATHLSSLELQILNEYAKQVGAVIYAAGDPNQRGSVNKKARLSNLEEFSVFSARSPKLSISLRDNNLQKYQNQEAVRVLLDEVNENYQNLTPEELDKYWPKAVNQLSKFGFKVYNHDVLNGDLITTDLNPELLAKIKAGKTVGFIGSNSSPYLQKLIEVGIQPTVLSMNEMQGQEFDFVVIDQDWKKPNADYSTKLFLTDLYTTMTRATTASIFIDNGLSDIIGKNVLNDNKSKAPSITDAVDELRKKKLSILDQFKLDLEEIKSEEEKKKTTEDQEEDKPVKNPDEDFINPDDKNIDQEAKELIQKSSKVDQDKFDSRRDFSDDGEQVVETFTDTTIIGAEVLEHQDRKINHNGKEVELKDIPVWQVKHPQNGPLRNLQALYDDGTEMITYGSKLEAQKALFDIKSYVMFQHSWDDLKSQIIKRNFNKSDWEAGELEIEIREPSSSDNTHLNAHYKESGFEYNGKRYIVNIVFKVKTADGREARFDVSGLPSVDYYYKQLPKIEKNLEARIQKAEGDEKTQLQERYNRVRATFNNYRTLIGNWITDFEAGNFKPIKIDASSLNFNKTTWLQEFSDSDVDIAIQLGGKLDPVTGERSTDSLEIRHPELVFSPIYTYASKEGKFEEIDQSLRGKAVVFVTSDTLLKPSELIHVYQEQKNNPKINKASVRMLVLDNYGMTFKQFMDPRFISAFQHGNEERKPFRQNYTGIRMFTSMWNWRASLKLFNEAVEKWKIESGYTDKQLYALLEADYLKYEKKPYDNILKNFNLKEEDLENLRKFNLQNCENIPTFRLGYSTNASGFHIRGNVDVSSSTVYDKDKVNLVAISPAKARQFYKLLDRIMSAIEYTDEFGRDSLGLRLLKEDKTPWDKTEFIDLSPNSSHRRTVAGLLSEDNGKIVLKADKVTIGYSDGNQWSMLPALVSNIVRTIIYYQHNESELNSVENQCAKITIRDGEEKVLFKTQIGDLFTSGDVQFGDDYSIVDMLNLIFHGTTDDIHKDLPKGTQLLQAEDAYFKKGFFINPDISRSSARHGDPEIVRITDAEDNVLFYEIATSKELFEIDTNVRTSGIGLKINQIYKQVQESEKTEEEVQVENPEDKFKREHPDLSLIIESGIAAGQNFEYNLDSIDEVIEWHNGIIKESIKDLIKQNDKNVLTEPYNVEMVGTTLKEISLQDYILQNITEKTITKVEFKNGKLLITSGNSEYIMEDALTIHKTSTTLVQESEQQQEQEQGGSTNTTSTYKTILSNGKALDSAILEIIQNEYQQIRIEKGDANVVKKRLEVIFSGKTDEEITRNLRNLENGSEVFQKIMTYLQMNYEEITNILDNC